MWILLHFYKSLYFYVGYCPDWRDEVINVGDEVTSFIQPLFEFGNNTTVCLI